MRVKIDEAGNYGNAGGDFFNLKDDKDTAQVRFLYEKSSDIELDAVHQIEIDGKTRFVSCLRSYDDPVDACPFCSAGFIIKVVLLIPLYNVDMDAIQIWTRGKKFAATLEAFCDRNNPVVGTICEVIRNGKRNDQTTTYSLYPIEADDSKLSDFVGDGEIEEVLEKIILNKSAEEMISYLEKGYFMDKVPDRKATVSSRAIREEPKEVTPIRRAVPGRSAVPGRGVRQEPEEKEVRGSTSPRRSNRKY